MRVMRAIKAKRAEAVTPTQLSISRTMCKLIAHVRRSCRRADLRRRRLDESTQENEVDG
jgi:hypothetical protein